MHPLLLQHEGNQISLEQLLSLRSLAQKIDLNRLTNLTMRNGEQFSPKLRGQGMEFLEVRNYQAFDDIRHLDWKVTARTGNPHTKVYCQQLDRSLFIVLDLSSSMQFGTRFAFKSVVALQLSALLGFSTVFRQNLVGGLVFNDERYRYFKPQASFEAFASLLKYALALLSKKTKANSNTLEKMISKITNSVKYNDVVVISDFMNIPDNLNTFMALARRNSIINFKLRDRIESALPQQDEYQIADQNNNIYFLRNDPAIQQKYCQFFAEKQEKFIKLNNFCQSGYASFFTDEDLLINLGYKI